MKTIKCFLVDDEPSSLERLNQILTNLPQVVILESITLPEKAINLIIEQRPDLVFIDIEMPRMSGFEVVKKVREINITTVFIFVTAFSQYAIKAIKESIFDYILKPYDLDEIKASIERFQLYRSTPINKPSLAFIEEKLSPREREILKLVLQCKTSQEIADELCISKLTVDTHRRNILKKTGLKSFSEFFHFAYP